MGGNSSSRFQDKQRRSSPSLATSGRCSSAGTTRTNSQSGFYLLYLIHRTWAVVSSENRIARFTHRKRGSQVSNSMRSNESSSTDSSSSLNSRYSYCSCSYCKNDELTDYTSDLQSDIVYARRMPPNSSEIARRQLGDTLNRKQNDANNQWLSEEDFVKEQQRPPIYNPEDYAVALRKWAKQSSSSGVTNAVAVSATSTLNRHNTPPKYGLYEIDNGTTGSNKSKSSSLKSRTNSAPPASGSNTPSSHHSHNYKYFNDNITLGSPIHHGSPNMSMTLTGDCATMLRDYRNPMLTTSSGGGEMTLRQFSTVSELLTKLRADLRFAFPSFVQELVSDPLDGVTLLLELLRGVQLSQAGGTVQRVPPAIQRRALLDELVCLQCLISCCVRHRESIHRLASSPAGLYTLAVCIMSNVSRSRIIALKLLTMACEPPGNGHTPVSESLSTLRLRFGEPVRFRFLVGVLSSAGNHGELLAAGLRFLNAFMLSANPTQKRLYVQAELEQAGFDVNVFRKIVPLNSPFAERVFNELDKWEKNIVNIEKITCHADEVERQNASLKEKMKMLERRVQVLQEEKGILISLEQCLKDRCKGLQDERIHSRKSKLSTTRRLTNNKKEDSTTPAEDEGISSSERSLSPDDDIQREPMNYDVISVKNDTILINKSHEEEATIEEVMEEFKNIVTNAETEEFRQKAIIKINNMENEIIPSNLHPQPPRKSKSLVHLFFSGDGTEQPVQYESRQQEIFFFDEDEPAYTSEDDDDDSLLSASKCQQQGVPTIDREEIIRNSHDNRALLNSIMDARERAEQYEIRRQQNKKRDPNPPKIKSIKQNTIDGLFIVDVNTPMATPILGRHQQKEITQEDKIKSKSLDRIDEGLASLIDIVLTNDSKKCQRKQSTYCKKISSDKNSVTLTTSTYYDDRHRVFLPDQESKAGSNKHITNISTDLENFHRRLGKSDNNSAFSITRGHCNAGMYSGTNHMNSLNSVNSGGISALMINSGQKKFSLPSSDYRSMTISSISGAIAGVQKTVSSSQMSNNSKVTDLPSGLY